MIVMKKLILSLLSLAGLVFPLTGQVLDDPYQVEPVPIESLVLKQKKIPPSIIEEIKSSLMSDKPIIGRNLPTVRDSYSWTIKPDTKENTPSFYEAYIKVQKGSNVFVKYNSDGTILESEIIRRNAALPYKVAEDLEKSQYKGWTVVGDKELIKYLSSRNNVMEHFKIIVEKNNVKRNIAFTYNEPV